MKTGRAKREKNRQMKSNKVRKKQEQKPEKIEGPLNYEWDQTTSFPGIPTSDERPTGLPSAEPFLSQFPSPPKECWVIQHKHIPHTLYLHTRRPLYHLGSAKILALQPHEVPCIAGQMCLPFQSFQPHAR